MNLSQINRMTMNLIDRIRNLFGNDVNTDTPRSNFDVNKYLCELYTNYRIENMSEYFKDYDPLKGSYEHLCSLDGRNDCKLIKFDYTNNPDPKVTILIDSRIRNIIQSFEVYNSDNIPEKPNAYLTYIIIYNNIDDQHNYIFNANSLILKYLEMHEESVKKIHEDELPKLNRIKEVIKEIL